MYNVHMAHLRRLLLFQQGRSAMTNEATSFPIYPACLGGWLLAGFLVLAVVAASHSEPVYTGPATIVTSVSMASADGTTMREVYRTRFGITR